MSFFTKSPSALSITAMEGPTKTGGQALGLGPRKAVGLSKQVAEVYGNRTHRAPCSDAPPDLKSGSPTSGLSTSTFHR